MIPPRPVGSSWMRAQTSSTNASASSMRWWSGSGAAMSLAVILNQWREVVLVRGAGCEGDLEGVLVCPHRGLACFGYDVGETVGHGDLDEQVFAVGPCPLDRNL